MSQFSLNVSAAPKPTPKRLMKTLKSSPKMPVLFIGHGSPMNAITDNPFRSAWRELGAELARPRAVLCVSAHWETRGPMGCATEPSETVQELGGLRWGVWGGG